MNKLATTIICAAVTMLGACVDQSSVRDAPPASVQQEQFMSATDALRAGDTSTALQRFEDMIDQGSRRVAVFVNAALIHDERGDPQSARSYLEQALEIESANVQANNQLGILARRDGDFAAARALYERALSISPEYAPANLNLAILCDLYLQDDVCASEHYASYLQVMPDDEQARQWLALVERRMQ